MSESQHGRDCPKVPHMGGGYLHAADYDRPYDVGGVAYCGRCHAWLGVMKLWPSCVPEDATPPASQGKLHDAIQQLPVYQMEGTFEGQAFSYVLVRRHEVQQAIYDAFQPASSQSEEPPT